MVNRQIDTAAKAQALCLVEFTGKSLREAERLTGVSARLISRYQAKAQELGFDLVHAPTFRDRFFAFGARSGRPRTCDNAMQLAIVKDLQSGADERAQLLDDLAAKWKISRSVIAWMLKQEGLNKVKPSMKPGLTDNMKQARYAFCMKYTDKDLEWWKNVIWTNETSVVLGSRRGGCRV